MNGRVRGPLAAIVRTCHNLISRQRTPSPPAVSTRGCLNSIEPLFTRMNLCSS